VADKKKWKDIIRQVPKSTVGCSANGRKRRRGRRRRRRRRGIIIIIINNCQSGHSFFEQSRALGGPSL